MSSTHYRLTWLLVFLVGASYFLSHQGVAWGSILGGIAVASGPLLCFLALIKGMDRWHLIGSDQWVAGLAWGGGVAAVIAGWFNGITELAISDWVAGSSFFTADQASRFSVLAGSILAAPFVEETGKGLLVLWGLSSLRRPLRSPLEAAFLGCLIALGFGAMENVAQYAHQFPSGGTWTWKQLLASPRHPTPMLHAFFTLPMASLVGRAAYSPSLSRRVGLVMLGWGCSIMIHAMWNLGVISRDKGLGFDLGISGLAYASVVLVPLCLLVIWGWEWRKLSRFRPACVAPAKAWVRLALLRRIASRMPLHPAEQEALAHYETAMQS